MTATDKTETIYGSVDSVTYRNDDNGFAVITLDHEGKPLTVVGELGNVEEGDLVKISVNNKNRIDGFLLVYDKSAKSLCVSNPYEPQTGAGYRSRDRMAMGYAYICKDGLLKFHKDMPTKDTVYTTDTENALLSSFSAIYVIDTNEANVKNSVYLGNENDIVDFLHAGAGCSKVIVSTNWADPEEIIVIK